MKPLIPLLALLIKTIFPTRRVDQQSPWHARLIRNFDGPLWATVFVGLSCLAPSVLLHRRLFESMDGVAVLMVVLIAASFAYALVRLEGIFVDGTDGTEADSSTRRTELFASVATKAFIICTLHLGVLSVSLSSLHVLTLGFTSLRMIEVSAVVLLVSTLATLLDLQLMVL